MADSSLERALDLQLRSIGVEFEREYRFAAIHTGGTGSGVRKRLKMAGLKDWRFDFAIPGMKIAHTNYLDTPKLIPAQAMTIMTHLFTGILLIVGFLIDYIVLITL